MEVNPLARRQILAVVEATLSRADVTGHFPTPLDRVADVAGISEIVDISEVPQELVIKKPRAWRRLLGAYLFRAETAFVDLAQPIGRARFIQAHEMGHRIIPWHEDSYYLDNEHRLFRETEELLEREANLAAAFLMFQGPRFHEQALGYERSIRTPIALAERFGASLHATIRYYVELHPDPVAVLIAGRYRRADGTVPLWSSVESPTFRARYGRLVSLLPKAKLSLGDGSGPVADLARAAFTAVEPPSQLLELVSPSGEAFKFSAEAFFNQRCLFFMVAPPRRVKMGRRISIAAG